MSRFWVLDLAIDDNITAAVFDLLFVEWDQITCHDAFCVLPFDFGMEESGWDRRVVIICGKHTVK